MISNFDHWIGKVAVVTGASSGIGAVVAERLVKEGLKVVGLARRKDKIDELSLKLSNEKGKLYAIKTDISKEAEILQAFKWIKENLGPVHILINNAGITYVGNYLTSGETEKWQEVFQVNVMGLSICTREAIQNMKANNVDGHIIHMNSIFGHKISPAGIKVNVYSASKFAITALTETLRLELVAEKSKIKVTSISPGAVKTEIVEFQEKNEHTFHEKYPVLNPEDVAEAICYILSTPPHVQVHELIIKPVGEPF